MYLMIENSGVCTVEELIILGLSTAREDVEKIGQFGTGGVHGINVLLRHNITPIFYLGTKKVMFFAEPRMARGKDYSIVCYKIGQAAKKETGFALEHGEMDWDNVHMACREFVSNALDSSENSTDIKIEIAENTRAKSGKTRVFIPLVPQVHEFYRTLYSRFLNFDSRVNQHILDKQEEEPARIYRKGVLVRQLETRFNNSLFDYNLGDNVKIDESRNMTDYTVQEACGQLLMKDAKRLAIAWKELKSGRECWESRFSEYNLTDYSDETKQLWQDTWKATFGDALICQAIDTYAASRAMKLGRKIVVFDDGGWYAACRKNGIKDVYSIVSAWEGKGCESKDPTENAVNTLDEVWGWFEALGVTKGKCKPELYCFKQLKEEDDAIIFGYHDQNKIYINEEFDTNHKTFIEELIHYCGNVSDYSRNWQEFALEMILSACQ